MEGENIELIQFGHTVQNSTWAVQETLRAGFVRVYRVESGSVYYHIEQKTVRLKEGTIYLFPSHSAYKISYDASTRFLCTWLHINIYPEILKDMVELDASNAPLCMDFFELITQIIIKNHHDLSAIQQTTSLFYEYYLKYKNIPKGNAMTDDIADKIQKEPEKKLLVSELAVSMGYTKEHYIRTFQKQVGVTPYQYIISCRMVRASFLLRQNHQISEVSHFVGYQDIRTFETAFKKFYGRTPSAYKKDYQINII